MTRVNLFGSGYTETSINVNQNLNINNYLRVYEVLGVNNIQIYNFGYIEKDLNLTRTINVVEKEQYPIIKINNIDDLDKDTFIINNDLNCYYFDPYQIKARINVFSNTLFILQDPPPTESNTSTITYDGIHNCTHSGPGSTDCTTYCIDYKRNILGELTQNQCNESNFIFGTYTYTHGPIHVKELGLNDNCTVDITQTQTSYCDDLNFQDEIFQCVDNNCILNRSGINSDFCSDPPNYDTPCVLASPGKFGPSSIDGANISSSFDRTNNKFGK